MEKLINKFKNLPNDRIGQDIFIAFEWSVKEDGKRQLVRIYLGSKTVGPMLQWFKPTITEEHGTEYNLEIMGVSETIKPWQLYNGYAQVDFKDGAWTNCYSRGNFGKNYAYGGNWSGHTKNLHPRLKVSPISDRNIEMLAIEGIAPMELPEGIKGNVQVTPVDCSGSWTIWYSWAKMALAERLKHHEINDAVLPQITKQHLLKNETEEVLNCLMDVIEAYDL